MFPKYFIWTFWRCIEFAWPLFLLDYMLAFYLDSLKFFKPILYPFYTSGDAQADTEITKITALVTMGCICLNAYLLDPSTAFVLILWRGKIILSVLICYDLINGGRGTHINTIGHHPIQHTQSLGVKVRTQWGVGWHKNIPGPTMHRDCWLKQGARDSSHGLFESGSLFLSEGTELAHISYIASLKIQWFWVAREYVIIFQPQPVSSAPCCKCVDSAVSEHVNHMTSWAHWHHGHDSNVCGVRGQREENKNVLLHGETGDHDQGCFRRGALCLCRHKTCS